MQLMLIGNPNSGKTTVFNHLTGSHQHVGNFPGITVEWKTGQAGKDTIIDLPGFYSLQPHSPEEAIAVNYLRRNPPDGIINCVDTTNLRRSLALTLSLMELQIPMILVANMIEECHPKPDLKYLEKKLGIPIFAVRQQNRWAPAVLLRFIRFEVEKKRIPHPLCKGTAEEKYRWIDGHLSLPKMRNKKSGYDQVFMHPIWGTVVCILIMAGIFFLTFHLIGPALTRPFMQGIEGVSAMVSSIRHPLLRTLSRGIVTGIGTVFSFLPVTATLFLCLALLEDSGYMVRICFLSENILAAVGLSGKSAVPLLMSFGCSVPAMLSTRIISDEQQRRRTLRLIPFISCSAKLPVYGILANQLYPQHPLVAFGGIYILGLGVGLLVTALSKKTSTPLLLENPPLRIPRIKNILFRVKGQITAFFSKAFTVLLLTSVLVTLLQQFTPNFSYTEDPSRSLLAAIAGTLVPLFTPIGLGHWAEVAALLSGLFAKESIVSVLAVTGATVRHPLPFLLFSALYPPCFSALSTLYYEAGFKETLRCILIHLALAYFLAWLF